MSVSTRNPSPTLSNGTSRMAPSRPLLAWFTLIAMFLLGVLFSLGVAKLLWLVAAQQLQVLNVQTATWAVAWRLVVALGSLITAFGIFRRTAWGRSFGLVGIAGLAVWNFVRIDNEPYPNEAQASGAWFGQYFIAPALLVWWAYAFAFSRKARNYFAKRTEA